MYLIVFFLIIIGLFLLHLCFISKDKEGLAEEKVWSQIRLPDYFPQYGEDS